jgi:hypothetical protein
VAVYSGYTASLPFGLVYPVLNGTVPDAVYYGLLGGLAMAGGIAFLRWAPSLKRLMAGVH